ncbi:Threonine dehydratase, mitochondrial [Hondaea fermentalgiana]|uniref:Threonine dehydratase n=1 Tax=Hondaea fermentalgiana TaxID=2315210 RepID=A0A2R5G9I2_9STRA|nr:Threonine dehydratase, mitochondrial [Hondaea fermentalgiana]|eukprot:GBG25153.1 Threonine dehydratase, mitochondrial [Hondaea fermentalgiana]
MASTTSVWRQGSLRSVAEVALPRAVGGVALGCREQQKRWSSSSSGSGDGNGTSKLATPGSNIARTTSGTWPPDLSESLTAQKPFSRMESGLDLLKKEALIDEYLRGILAAQSVVYDVSKETDLQYASTLSRILGNDVFLKREDQQPVHSFKLRGAYNKIISLPRERLEKGIVACSAGNHAQGVALSAQNLGIDAVICMPKATPRIKVDAVRKYGGNVLLVGNNYDEAQAEAMRLAAEGRTLIHPFDDPMVICGQGTIGMEIVKQLPNENQQNLEAIFCCVGGGGLLAGVSTYIKKVLPHVHMIGVEAEDAAGMTASLAAGKVTTLSQVGLFADGASVRTVGSNTFALVKELCNGMVTVTTDEICAAIKAGFNDTRTVFEPAGALSIAGLVRYVATTGVQGKTLVAVASGANMDFDRLRYVSERADSSENLVAIEIPEKRGSFWDLYNMVYPRNVTEFSYRYDPSNEGSANVILNFQAASVEDREKVMGELMAVEDYKVHDLQENDLAKTHVRYMAGGRALRPGEERLFRFEFPERPGALREFLEKVHSSSGRRFNISLFHYRNHGADVGRVLVGLQADDSGEEAHVAINDFLQELGFYFVEETANEAYHKFLLHKPVSA